MYRRLFLLLKGCHVGGLLARQIGIQVSLFQIGGQTQFSVWINCIGYFIWVGG